MNFCLLMFQMSLCLPPQKLKAKLMLLSQNYPFDATFENISYTLNVFTKKMSGSGPTIIESKITFLFAKGNFFLDFLTLATT